MNYNVILTPEFKKLFKKLYKKYPSLKNDLAILVISLEKDYTIGISLGSNLFKVRLAIESKTKGKSGGARVVYFFLNQDNEVYLVHIYDKSEYENITKETLITYLKNAGLV